MRHHKTSGSTLFAAHPAIFRHNISKLYLFEFQIKYAKELRYLNTKGKHGKVADTEIKWSIISKSVMIIIFVKFIDQLIDYPINCAILKLISSLSVPLLRIKRQLGILAADIGLRHV